MAERNKQSWSKPHLWLINFIGLIVPRRLRGDWRHEWEAELRYRELLLADWDRLNWRTKSDLLRRSLGAFWDALLLQPRRLEDEMFQDLRYGTRMLLKYPGFTLIAVLTLALGIGANTAIFTLVNVVMLKSLPVSHPEELVMLTLNAESASQDTSSVSRVLWEQIRDHQDVFDQVCVYGSSSADLSNGGEERPVNVGLVSGEFFSTLGVRTLMGRAVTNADDRPGRPAVAVITHLFWQSEFGGSADIIGKSVDLNGEPFQIVGVTEPDFFGVEFGWYVPIWTAQHAEAVMRSAGGSGTGGGGWVIGRLKPGLTRTQSRARLAALTPAILEATLPTTGNAEAAAQYRKSTFDVRPFSKGIPFLRERFGEALFMLMAIVGVVLLIACANVANLLLARASARQHEIGVRLALGASRSRLIRQLLTESVLLSVLGAASGVVFASWGSRVLVGFLSRPGRQVLSLDVTPDLRVLAFTIAISALTGVLFGLAPAWRAVGVDPHTVMKPSGRGIAEGHSRFSIGKALVVAQITLSLAMIAGAGLLLDSWRGLVAVDPGFRSDGVLLANVDTRPTRLSGDKRSVTYNRILERLRAIPGAAVASAAWRTPFGSNAQIAIEVEGYAPASANEARVQMNQVSDGYFATIGTPLLAGRDFNTGDVPSSPKVAIISEELARRFFAGASALGQHFRVPAGSSFSDPIEIIGVAADTKEFDLREESKPIVYFAFGQEKSPGPSFNFALRTEGSPSSLIPGVKTALSETDPHFSLSLRTLQQQVDETVRLPRTLGMLSGFFGALALVLAAVGLYGVISFSVGRRRNEIGVRIALGATQARVFRMVLAEVGRMLVVGLALGVLLALALTRLVATFLFGVESNDPATLALSALVLAAVSIGAAMIPAWRAARLDPMSALRDE